MGRANMHATRMVMAITRFMYEVHVNTMEGAWSLLRSWLRPHRGVSQERLPLYVGFFQFVHNVRRRGKALLRTLVETLLSTRPETE